MRANMIGKTTPPSQSAQRADSPSTDRSRPPVGRPERPGDVQGFPARRSASPGQAGASSSARVSRQAPQIISRVPAGFPARISQRSIEIARSLSGEQAHEIHRLVHHDGLGHVLLGDLVPRVAARPGRAGIRLEGPGLDAVAALERVGGLRPGLALVRCEAHEDPDLGSLPAVGFLLDTRALQESADMHREVIAHRTGDRDSSPASAIVAMLGQGDAALDCVVEAIVLGYGRSSGEQFESNLAAGQPSLGNPAMDAHVEERLRQMAWEKPYASVPPPEVPDFIKANTSEVRELIDNYVVQSSALQDYLQVACEQTRAQGCEDFDLAVTAAVAEAACGSQPLRR